jgi:hypothetical protein
MPHSNLKPARPQEEVTPILGWWPWFTLVVAALLLALGVWRFTSSPRAPAEPRLGAVILALGALLIVLLRAHRRREDVHLERELAGIEATDSEEPSGAPVSGVQHSHRDVDPRFRRVVWTQELAIALAALSWGLSLWLGYPTLRSMGTALGFGVLAWGLLPLGHRLGR